VPKCPLKMWRPLRKIMVISRVAVKRLEVGRPFLKFNVRFAFSAICWNWSTR
jgi:hypothetical protein